MKKRPPWENLVADRDGARKNQDPLGILREFGVDPDTQGIDILVSDRVPQDFLTRPAGFLDFSQPFHPATHGSAARGGEVPGYAAMDPFTEASMDSRAKNETRESPQKPNPHRLITEDISRNVSIELPSHPHKRAKGLPVGTEATLYGFRHHDTRTYMAGGINHIENSTFGFQGSILDPTVATIQQNNPSIDQMTKNSSYRICPSDQLAFGGFSDLLPDTSPGLQNKISDHLVPHDSVPVPRPHQFQPDFHLHQLSICKRGAELVDYFPGTQTAFPDIRGEIINKGKRGPKPRNTNCPRSNDVYEKLFKERKVFRAFIEERDCRLISFFCCFRSVFCEKNQVRFEKAISRLLGCRWAKKLLAYIFLLQPRSVKKNEQYQKKIFKLTYKQLNFCHKTRVMALSESKPRTRETESDGGLAGGDSKRRNKIEKRLSKKKQGNTEPGFDPFPDSSEGSDSEEFKDIAYNSKTFEAVGKDPILGAIFNTSLASLRKEIIPQLFGDLITEVSSVVKFYQKVSGDSVISQLPTDGSVSQYLDLYYSQWDYLLLEGGQAEKSKTKKKRTLKLPWTYRVFFDAIENLEKAMGIERSMEAADSVVYFMGPMEALTLAENSRLLNKELMALVWEEIKEMVHEADILDVDG